jgi:hypothetical protein
MQTTKFTFEFCLALQRLGRNRCKAMSNVVMALLTSPAARSPIEITESPFYHYHYSNLTKVMSKWKVTQKELLTFLAPFLCPPREMPNGTKFYSLVLDVSKILKPFSHCLEGVGYVPIANNVISGNKPISIGFSYSSLNANTGELNYCLPLLMEIIELEANSTQVGVDQLKLVMEDKSLPFGTTLTIVNADNSYGKAAYLAPIYVYKNLVGVTRHRYGSKTWSKAVYTGPTGGTNKIFGDTWYLTFETKSKTYHKKGVPYEVHQTSIFDLEASEVFTTDATLANGRKVIITIKRFSDMLIRSKNGHNMKDKPMDFLAIKVLDAETRELVFDKPLFVSVAGLRKNEVITEEVHNQYRGRWGIEPTFGFNNEHLLLNSFQTPKKEHLGNWMNIVQLATWLLYTARTEISKLECKEWQKYSQRNKAAAEDPSRGLDIFQVHASIKNLFCTFPTAPFLPAKSNKGKGRAKGTKFTPRQRHKPIKKGAARAEKAKAAPG